MHFGPLVAAGGPVVGGGAGVDGGNPGNDVVVVCAVPSGASWNAYTPAIVPAAATPRSRMPATAYSVSLSATAPPATPPPISFDHSTSPVFTSTARNVKSVVLPVNATPLTIDDGANVGAAASCCHASAPFATS